MSNLERPRHGWEGLSNGGEIYSNSVDQPVKESQEQTKLETFDNMISKGMDRVVAYMIVYGMGHEEAVQTVNNYNYLISSGIPPKMASEIVLKSTEESNYKTR